LGGAYITTDTFDIDDVDFGNPMNFGTISQTIAQLNGSIMITAVFASDSVQPCDVPTGLHYTDIQNESIAIAWDANPNVNIWNIQYRMVGSSSFSSATSTTNSYNITNLTGLTNYEIQVQAVCENGTSDWCEPITVQTTNVGIEEHLLNSISLYPNPAKDVVNVQCALNDVQVRAIEVFDVYGKVVRTVETLHATSLQDIDEQMSKISPKPGTLATIIRGLKSAVTCYANQHNIPFAWQPRFHDHIIRNNDDMNTIAEYIENNVAQWECDRFYG
jgi:hypothetical protein